MYNNIFLKRVRKCEIFKTLPDYKISECKAYIQLDKSKINLEKLNENINNLKKNRSLYYPKITTEKIGFCLSKHENNYKDSIYLELPSIWNYNENTEKIESEQLNYLNYFIDYITKNINYENN